MSLANSYTLADVTHWYSMQEIQKAKAYLNSIGDLEIQADKIIAQVKGSAARPYTVEIFLDTDEDGSLRIDPIAACVSLFANFLVAIRSVLIKIIQGW